jgi:hypothetical protein
VGSGLIQCGSEGGLARSLDKDRAGRVADYTTAIRFSVHLVLLSQFARGGQDSGRVARGSVSCSRMVTQRLTRLGELSVLV